MKKNLIRKKKKREYTYHQKVEKGARRCVVSHHTIQIDCPEEGMRIRVSRVRERDEVDGDVANDAFLVENITNWLTDCHKIHIR